MIGFQSSAVDMTAAVRAGSMKATELVEESLRHIEQFDPIVNAFTAVVKERALARAASIDEAVSSGVDAGPLCGVPFAVKNLYDIRNETTLAGAALTQSDPPASEDALLIRRLEAAGGILIGALNMGEFAYDFTGENAHYGACRNPWDTDRMSGGSSSGSGAALAAGMVPLTLGTDTNGSIRVPSSLCGVMGLKPTYGRLPRTGAYPFCDSLDHVGPMARRVGDLVLAYEAMLGFSESDRGCVMRDDQSVSEQLDVGLDGLKIGIANDYFEVPEMVDAMSAVAVTTDSLKDLGAEITSVTIPLAEAGRAAAFLITNAESARLHQERLIENADGFDPDTRDRFLAGLLMPAGWYLKAQAVRARYADEVNRLFESIDVIIAPAVPMVAPKVGETEISLGGETLPLRPNLGYFTQPISSIGLPVVCVPAERSDGLPMGVQIIAAPWREDLCLRVARSLECAGKTMAPVAPDFLEGND